MSDLGTSADTHVAVDMDGASRELRAPLQRVPVDTASTDRIPPYNRISQEHRWAWAVLFQANPALFGDPTHEPVLDTSNLLAVHGPGCVYCDQPYTKLTATRRCRGPR